MLDVRCSQGFMGRTEERGEPKQTRLLPKNRPKDLGRTKMGKGRRKHLCPSQIFGRFAFPVLGFKERISFRGILSPALIRPTRRARAPPRQVEWESFGCGFAALC